MFFFLNMLSQAALGLDRFYHALIFAFTMVYFYNVKVFVNKCDLQGNVVLMVSN